MRKRIPPQDVLEERRVAETDLDDWLAGEDEPWMERGYVPGDWIATMRMFAVAIGLGVAIWAGIGFLVYWLVT
jgi:hypothetical protein